jgi:hypothetical protein
MFSDVDAYRTYQTFRMIGNYYKARDTEPQKLSHSILGKKNNIIFNFRL